MILPVLLVASLPAGARGADRGLTEADLTRLARAAEKPARGRRP